MQLNTSGSWSEISVGNWVLCMTENICEYYNYTWNEMWLGQLQINWNSRYVFGKQAQPSYTYLPISTISMYIPRHLYLKMFCSWSELIKSKTNGKLLKGSHFKRLIITFPYWWSNLIKIKDFLKNVFENITVCCRQGYIKISGIIWVQKDVYMCMAAAFTRIIRNDNF